MLVCDVDTHSFKVALIFVILAGNHALVSVLPDSISAIYS